LKTRISSSRKTMIYTITTMCDEC